MSYLTTYKHYCCQYILFSFSYCYVYLCRCVESRYVGLLCPTSPGVPVLLFSILMHLVLSLGSWTLWQILANIHGIASPCLNASFDTVNICNVGSFCSSRLSVKADTSLSSVGSIMHSFFVCSNQASSNGVLFLILSFTWAMSWWIDSWRASEGRGQKIPP